MIRSFLGRSFNTGGTTTLTLYLDYTTRAMMCDSVASVIDSYLHFNLLYNVYINVLVDHLPL